MAVGDLVTETHLPREAKEIGIVVSLGDKKSPVNYIQVYWTHVNTGENWFGWTHKSELLYVGI